MFGISMGPSSGEYGATNALTGESGFAGSMGEGLISNSSALINGLLSGNQSDIAKLLAPQIGAISKQANEKTQTNATFGARSGGTNASNQNTMDTARSSVNDMISSLTWRRDWFRVPLWAATYSAQSMSGYNDVFSQNNTEQQQTTCENKRYFQQQRGSCKHGSRSGWRSNGDTGRSNWRRAVACWSTGSRVLMADSGNQQAAHAERLHGGQVQAVQGSTVDRTTDGKELAGRHTVNSGRRVHEVEGR